MPYVQTSVTRDELAELHSRAIKAGKPLQRLVYEYIQQGLNISRQEDTINERCSRTDQAAKETGKKRQL